LLTPYSRRNAIDERDDLEVEAAASRVLELAADPDPDVRQAAETFMRNRQPDPAD